MQKILGIVGVMAVAMLTGCGGSGTSDLQATPNSPQPTSLYGIMTASQATATGAPQDNPQHASGYLSIYNGPRDFAYGDFDHDGCTDMVVTPTYFNHKPNLPMEIYRGDCKGGFVKSTETLVTGAIPATGSVNNIFVRDFNGDGRDDILIIDQGLEDKDAMNPGFDGGQNILLLSDAPGKLTLQASTFMDDNGKKFNHLSAVGDLDGDGSLDLVLVRLGGPNFGPGGVQVFLNDGHGHFTENTTLLPAAVSPLADQFGAGGAAIADLDDDGKPEIVLTSYSNAQQTAILKLNAETKKYEIVQRYNISNQYVDIGYFSATKAADNGRGLGGSSVVMGDFNGDGKKDIAILWEGSNKSYVQVLQGIGGGKFTDATAWLDGITVDHAINAGNVPVSYLSVADANNDGVDDLVAHSYSYSANDLATRSPFLVFNKAEGKLKFMRIMGNLNSSQFAVFMGTAADEEVGLRVVDLNRDGKLDFLAVQASSPKQITSQLTYFEKTTFYGAVAR